jgi:outer membrane protein assembly factor BamB
MHRGALRFGAFLLALTTCGRAFAHGLPPDAYAVLSRDAEGVRAVSLSAGVALRRSAQRYQFVCPEAWGDQFPAAVAALADGTIVVGGSRGLMLLGEDGTLRAHPDPAAVGRSSDVVRSALGVFALRPTPAGSELLAIDAEQVRVLWKDSKSMYSLAALDDKLVLLRVSGTLLEQVTIAAADGTELERQTASVDQPVDNVFARANAGKAYAIVVFRSVMVALGSLSMNVFTKLAEGELSIAGPLSVESGTLLAIDGKLAQLVDGQAMPLADDHKVVCLGQHDGLTYACDQDGIAPVSGQTLGEPLFRFSWLAGPNLDQVPEGDARMYCNTQWQDLRFDVQLTGASLLVDSMRDAGSAPADASIAAGGVDAKRPGAALAEGGVPDAGGGPTVVPRQQSREGGASCAAHPGRSTPRAAYGYAFAAGLALALVRWRRGRSRLDIKTAQPTADS